MCRPEGEDDEASLTTLYVLTNSSGVMVISRLGSSCGRGDARVSRIHLVSGSRSCGNNSGMSPWRSACDAVENPLHPIRFASEPEPNGVS